MVHKSRRLKVPTFPDHLLHDQQNSYLEHALTTPQPVPTAPIAQDVYIARESANEGHWSGAALSKMHFVAPGLLAAALASLVTAAPSANSIGSDLQILLHNDLYGNQSSRDDALIVLKTAQTYEQAKKACAALSESLWKPTSNGKDADFLAYLNYNSGSQHGGRSRKHLYHVSGKGPHGSCKSIDASSGHVKPIDCKAKLPALCTQSAILSYVNNTDTSASKQTTVTSDKAIYTGWRDKLSFRFLGIKYASFPQRFVDSSPTSLTGNVSALDFGSICASRDGRYGPVRGGEDCLFLNIYTPYLPATKTSKKSLRPVMLWIHGGAFVGGSGSDPVFDGGNLASRGDVVVVTMNYRFEQSLV